VELAVEPGDLEQAPHGPARSDDRQRVARLGQAEVVIDEYLAGRSSR
jgi:hypothetical protein